MDVALMGLRQNRCQVLLSIKVEVSTVSFLVLKIVSKTLTLAQMISQVGFTLKWEI